MRRVVLALAAALLSFGQSAYAQPAESTPASDEDKALAATLFDEGRALVAQGKVHEACRKLEESRRLDPLPGTILNLAACHEREGLLASAMVEFREARALAERDRREDRVVYAEQHLKAIAPRLSTLVIVVPAATNLPDLTIIRDGVAIGRAAWGERIPLDPGTHVIEATAPHKQMQHLEVRVGPDADVQTVTIAALADAVATAAPAPPATENPAAPQRHGGGLSTRRQWAIVSAGVGVAGVVTGTIAGIVAITKHNSPDAACNATPCPTAESLNHDAQLAADTSTASFAVGLVGLGLGAFLWFGDSSVNVTAGVGSVRVGGRF